MTSTSSGVLVAMACSLVMLAVGVAHYRGRMRWLAGWWMFSPYTGLSAAWWGAAGLLSGCVHLLDGVGSTVADIALLLVGAAAVVAWLVGLMGIVWLPKALRPRWLLDSQAAPWPRDPGPGVRTPT